ncbi:MAG TPA: site-2 protease family protein [Thermomicrobiales bacterium]|nr:site-2 protease family protein [Thermomicrobiales bacterium]
MGFDPFIFISLFYAAIGVRLIYQLVQGWHDTWDLNFTQHDRLIVDQAAFFVLIPISVVLHELGHAVTIWAMGGEVLDFGFYGFAGFVSYDPTDFTKVQQMIVAAAGSIVNLLLILIALALVFLRRPPMRAAYNELAIQFIFISGLNAFIAYPILDVLSGLNGDWRQMYDGGVPWLTSIIVIVQLAVIGAGYWLHTNPRMKARIASLTDIPPGYERALLGGIRQGTIDTTTLSPAEAALYEAGDRVASGWPVRVKTGIQRFNGGTAVTLEWTHGDRPRVVAARTFANGTTDLIAIPVTTAGGAPQMPRSLHRWPVRPNVDDLTIGLRMAMETVDREG